MSLNFEQPAIYELLSAGKTVTATICVDQLQTLVNQFEKKRPRRSIAHFLHDNVRPHIASDTHQKIAEFDWHPVIRSSYSLGLALLDYHLFRSLKLHLRERKIDKYDDFKTAVDKLFVSQSPEFWAQGNTDLSNKWIKVIGLNGEYFYFW